MITGEGTLVALKETKEMTKEFEREASLLA
jgi:hypothetical protein